MFLQKVIARFTQFSQHVAKCKLGQLQYKGIRMNVSPEFQQQQDSHCDRVVKAFFTQFDNQIKVYAHAKRNASLEVSSPRNSWYKVVLPLATNPELNFKFKRFYTNQVRIGRLLELMDYIASTVSYRYIEPAENATIVTAMVDNINFFEKIDADKDLEIQGYVTFVGNSSIEVYIDVLQNVNGLEVVNVSANFLMVARESKDHSKAYAVPKLDISQEEDKDNAQLRQYIGQTAQKDRKKLKEKALEKAPPTQEEIADLHQFFVVKPPSEWKQINETMRSKTMLMHLQDKNLHGKIFGGFVMREAFELGWLNAYLHVKGQGYPQVIHIDDINFLSPVDIGSALNIQSRITYVEKSLMHVEVNCEKINPNSSIVKTNDLHLTFSVGDTDISMVYPRTYQEGMRWLNAKRRLNWL